MAFWLSVVTDSCCSSISLCFFSWLGLSPPLIYNHNPHISRPCPLYISSISLLSLLDLHHQSRATQRHHERELVAAPPIAIASSRLLLSDDTNARYCQDAIRCTRQAHLFNLRCPLPACAGASGGLRSAKPDCELGVKNLIQSGSSNRCLRTHSALYRPRHFLSHKKA